MKSDTLPDREYCLDEFLPAPLENPLPLDNSRLIDYCIPVFCINGLCYHKRLGMVTN